MLTQMKFQDVDTIIYRCVEWRTPDLGHTFLQEQLTETNQKSFASPSRKGDKKEKEKKTRMAITNFFALHGNVIRCSSSARFNLFCVHFHQVGVKTWQKLTKNSSFGKYGS